MDRIALTLGEEVLESLPFDGRPVEVGRSRGNDLVVPDPAVADYHLVVRSSSAGPVAIDRTGRGIPDGEGSSERVRLCRGARIALGRFALELCVGEESDDPTRQTLVVEGADREALPALELVSVADPSRTHPVRATETRVGSAPDNHVVLADRFVSSRHCRIRAEEGAYVVRDLESRNGTWVNGTRVAAAQIHPGARLRVGTTDLLCRSRTASPDFGLVGRSAALRELRRDLARLAPLEGPVLVQGESGSGKELVARAIHSASSRVSGPYVALNCAALSPELVESELFGHERGAFTGAVGRRRGAFELAHEGTLFLDEVGDLPLPQQAKLLRALEEHAIRRIGGELPVPVDVRIVAATHVDLRRAIERRAFREDLYHRLAVLCLNVPPLRERPEDVEPLARHFLESFGDELGVRCLSSEALQRMRRYVWPGNVRELRNVLYRAAADATGACIEPVDLRLEDWLPVRAPDRSFDPEREKLRDLLARHGGVVARAARELGVSRETLRDRIRSAAARTRRIE